MLTTPDDELRQKVRQLIDDRPYYICKRNDEHTDLQSQMGSIISQYSRREDRINEEYLQDAIMQLLADQRRRDAAAIKAKLDTVEQSVNDEYQDDVMFIQLDDARAAVDAVLLQEANESNPEVFTDDEFDEAEHKLQNCIRITTNVESFTTEVYTGLRWIPVSEYVRGLIEYIRKGGTT
jgi:DNA polymerase III alpha subunit